MLNLLKTRLGIISVILSLSFLTTGISSCDTKPDAYKCILVIYDTEGHKMSLEEWYWFCPNMKTDDEKIIMLKDSERCIRNQNNKCKWTATDLNEEDIIRKHYEMQCKPKLQNNYESI